MLFFELCYKVWRYQVNSNCGKHTKSLNTSQTKFKMQRKYFFWNKWFSQKKLSSVISPNFGHSSHSGWGQPGTIRPGDKSKKYQLSSLSVSVFSTVMMQMFRERWCSYLSCKKHKNPESFRDKKNLRFKVKYSLQYLYLYNDKFCNRNKLQLPCFHDSTY